MRKEASFSMLFGDVSFSKMRIQTRLLIHTKYVAFEKCKYANMEYMTVKTASDV